MRFPWQRDVLLPEPLPTERVEVAVDEPTRETRQSGGDFSDAVVRLIEQTAAGSTADARGTASTESAAGALSRAFAAAEVVGPPWVQQAVSPTFLGQVGRDLIRSGDSLHVIRVNPMGKAVLLPCSSWHFEGDADPDTWMVRATVFGPSSSQTWLLPYSSVIFVKWGSDPGTPYVGTAPSSYASTTNRMLTATQKTLADESGGPLANLLVSPQDGGDGDEDTDPLADLKRDIRNATGAGLMVETTNAGWGEGKASAPQGDWTPKRYGPMPPAPLYRTLRAGAWDDAGRQWPTAGPCHRFHRTGAARGFQALPDDDSYAPFGHVGSGASGQTGNGCLAIVQRPVRTRSYRACGCTEGHGCRWSAAG